jgi:hypothetical protein
LLQAELAATNHEVLALTMELEKRVEERTAALQEAQKELEIRNAKLQAMNKELETFSYSVSHDLRAPLRHVLGFAQALEEDYRERMDEQGREYLSRISEAAQRMTTLIDALLSFGRAGQRPLQRTDIDSGALVADVIAELRSDQGERQIDWIIHPLPRVRGDSTLLRQVWTNLIANAIKYTRHQPAPRIEIGSLAAQGQESVFFIRDNGAGFDMSQYAKLFGLFQRLHRRDEFEGTGVGLANVRRILERHDGRIWAEAKPDQGATFYFALPAG